MDRLTAALWDPARPEATHLVETAGLGRTEIAGALRSVALSTAAFDAVTAAGFTSLPGFHYVASDAWRTAQGEMMLMLEVSGSETCPLDEWSFDEPLHVLRFNITRGELETPVCDQEVLDRLSCTEAIAERLNRAGAALLLHADLGI